MAVIGEGVAHGACSLLHAAPLGYGASLALDMPVMARLRDSRPKGKPRDPHNLLDEVIEAWEDAGHPLPADELYWSIRSKIPPGRGLKSSSAVAIAALRALEDAADLDLPISDLVDMAATAQLAAGVSLTGSKDDAWAAATVGWKLIDTSIPAAEGILLEGAVEEADEWLVYIVVRPQREELPDPSTFTPFISGFEKALEALQQENGELVALTWNGRSVASSQMDHEGRRIVNEALLKGARAAGITGSGPAIICFVPFANEVVGEQMKTAWESRGYDVIETTILEE